MNVNIERCQVINGSLAAKPVDAAVVSERKDLDLSSPFFTAQHEELSNKQELALEELRRGGTFVEAARVADVSRMTIYRWLKKDAGFRAVYYQWLDEVRQSSRTRLVSLTYKAITALQNSISDGDGRLAFQMLRSLGILQSAELWPVENAMTDAESVRRIDAIRAGQLNETLQKEEDRLARQKKDAPAARNGTEKAIEPPGSPKRRKKIRRKKFQRS